MRGLIWWRVDPPLVQMMRRKIDTFGIVLTVICFMIYFLLIYRIY